MRRAFCKHILGLKSHGVNAYICAFAAPYSWHLSLGQRANLVHFDKCGPLLEAETDTGGDTIMEHRCCAAGKDRGLSVDRARRVGFTLS